jgi:Tfp pilus assembly protein PilX
VRERLRQEDGIALLLALGMSVALSLLVFGMTQYVTSSQKSAQASSTDAIAKSYAEAALNTAYSRIQYANSTTGTLTGINPSLPTLLGCSAANTDGSSNCSTVTEMCVPVAASCPSGTYTPTPGTAVVSGAFTGTSTTTSYGGVSGTASQWLLLAKGYARNPSGKTITKTLRGIVTVSGADSGAVASVWNHVFLTKPLVAGVCQNTFSANNAVLDIPIYAIGNVCLTGQNILIKEVSGGQAVDLQIGGKLIYGGSGDTVGDYSTSPATGITSGVVVGGCATAIGNAGIDCASNFQYKVKAVGTFISESDPELDDEDIKSNYTNFDPGPRHPCASSASPANLTTSQLDFAIGSTEGVATTGVLPGNSGSGSSGGAFNLTPATSYACVSTSGTSKGYLIWNAGTSSITVSGITVAAKQLAIGGSIYIDAPLNITQTMTYKGIGIIMTSGKITFSTNNQTICAQNTSCLFTNWQGSTGNTDMLTLATVIKNSASAIDFEGNANTFMGSFWMSPTSTLYINANTPTLIGPMSLGAINSGGNSFVFRPLPIIKNMPVGAPVPPNVSASISPLTVIG